MDVKYIEPLLRRAMSQPFPETLHTIIEIIKRLPIPTTGSKLPKQFANVEETIRELLKNNIFSINGAPMDSISELDILQRLGDTLEHTKKEFLEFLFPSDDPSTHELYCKFVSFCLSLRLSNALRKMARYTRLIDVNHPMRIAMVNALRNDFCQIYYLNANDLLRLPLLARDMSASFINTFFYQPENLTDFVTFKVIANWLVKEPELIILSRPSTAKIITSMLKAVSASELDHADAWKLHFAMIESFQHRKLASMGVKRPTVPSYMERVSSDNLPPLLRLSGTDIRKWVESANPPTDMTTNMLLQILQVGVATGNLTLTKEDMEWSIKHIQQNEFKKMLEKTGKMDVS